MLSHGSQTPLGIAGMVEVLGQLNEAFPPIHADIPRIPDDPDVHSPLQDIFDTYMGSLFFVIQCCETVRLSPCKFYFAPLRKTGCQFFLHKT